MNIYSINAEQFKKLIISATANLKNNEEKINQLNVFPVPDGDTGLNMCKTLEGGVLRIKDKEYTSCSDVAEDFIHGALFSARGNSGVILSQICKGIQIGVTGLETLDGESIIKALNKGVELAYQAVDTPVEGTILTVYRMATEYVNKHYSKEMSLDELIKIHIEEAERTLEKTIDMLPQLKEANVVDSGGAGYVEIAIGAYKGLTGEELELNLSNQSEQSKELDYSAFTRDSVMEYGYCTELIIRLQSSKVDVDNFDVNEIKNFLKDNNGDSIVTYIDGDVVKVHVHTLTPGIMLNGLQKYGEFLHIKIENMTLQHEETIKEDKGPKKKVASVIVANGEGLTQVFTKLGADGVVNGGQTGNPSSGDFIEVFKKINAENIIVLPNNGNIIMAAEQAKELYKDANIIVVHTKTIQQGYAALSMMMAAEELDDMLGAMNDAIDNVSSYEVTYAIRDAVINGVSVNKDQFMCIGDGKLVASNDDKVEVLIDALSKVPDMKYKEIVTVFYGKDVTEEEKSKLAQFIEKKYPRIEFVEFNGDQDIYSFLLSVE